MNIYWISQATVDIGRDEELVRLAAESGCFGLFLGFDSISKLNLNDMEKKHNQIEEYNKTVELLHKYGIGIESGFIFGFDNDDKSVFKNTFEFLKETNTESFLAMYLTPVPGTRMYEEFKKENRLLKEDYSKYDFRHVVIKPEKMTSKQIYEGVNWISKEFNSKKLMAKRILYKFYYFLKHPSIRSLLGVIGTLAINLAFRSRIKDLSEEGAFPKSFRNI